jgi:hypothetical protein
VTAPRRQKSGYQKRLRARQKKVEAVRAQADELGMILLAPAEVEQLRRQAASGSSTMSPTLASLLKRIPEPTLEPTANIEFASRVAAALLFDTIRDGALDPRERRRVGADLVRTIGMTYSRALQQHKLEEIAARIVPPDHDDPRSTEIEPGEWARRRAEMETRSRQPFDDAQAENSGPSAVLVEGPPHSTGETP